MMKFVLQFCFQHSCSNMSALHLKTLHAVHKNNKTLKQFVRKTKEGWNGQISLSAITLSQVVIRKHSKASHKLQYQQQKNIISEIYFKK